MQVITRESRFPMCVGGDKGAGHGEMQLRVLNVLGKQWRRGLRATPVLNKLIPFKLADIGEGITEVEIIQW
jgi:hypothetical protein